MPGVGSASCLEHNGWFGLILNLFECVGTKGYAPSAERQNDPVSADTSVCAQHCIVASDPGGRCRKLFLLPGYR